MSPEQARRFAERLAADGQILEAFRAVEPAYPDEGCGFIFADGEHIYVLPTENRAQWLHEKNPEQYPRGSRDWFEPDMKPWLQASRAGHEPRAIFHSHPDVGAYFSEGDHDSAVVIDETGATVERTPGVVHLVVSVRHGRADGAALFRFDARSATFVEMGRYDGTGAWSAATAG